MWGKAVPVWSTVYSHWRDEVGDSSSGVLHVDRKQVASELTWVGYWKQRSSRMWEPQSSPLDMVQLVRVRLGMVSRKMGIWRFGRG